MFCPSRKLIIGSTIFMKGGCVLFMKTSFEDLLKKNGSVSIHHRYVQLVAIQMFKVKYDMCPEIMKDLFHLNTNPNINKTFFIPQVKTEYMGKLSLRYFGPVVWETMLPENYKSITTFATFRDKIKTWIPKCKCRLCKPYVANVGFT
jgi:hypothetical protein